MKATYMKSWAGNVLMSDLTLGTLLQDQTRTAKLKSAYNWLIIGLEVCNVKPNLQEIMGWESF